LPRKGSSLAFAGLFPSGEGGEKNYHPVGFSVRGCRHAFLIAVINLTQKTALKSIRKLALRRKSLFSNFTQACTKKRSAEAICPSKLKEDCLKKARIKIKIYLSVDNLI